MLYAAAGYHVCMYDNVESQLNAALADIQSQLKDLKAKDLLRGRLNVDEQFSRISVTSSLKECVQDSFFVQV